MRNYAYYILIDNELCVSTGIAGCTMFYSGLLSSNKILNCMNVQFAIVEVHNQ